MKTFLIAIAAAFLSLSSTHALAQGPALECHKVDTVERDIFRGSTTALYQFKGEEGQRLGVVLAGLDGSAPVYRDSTVALIIVLETDDFFFGVYDKDGCYRDAWVTDRVGAGKIFDVAKVTAPFGATYHQLPGIKASFTLAAFDPLTGQDRKDWIKGLQNAEKNTCCSEADGQTLRTDEWEARGDSYWVYLHQDGQWHKVEPWMLVTAPNLVGYAMVWIYGEEPGGEFGEEPDGTRPLKWNVRCFMAGALG